MVRPHAGHHQAGAPGRVVACKDGEPLEGRDFESRNDGRQRLVLNHHRLNHAAGCHLHNHQRLARVTPVLPHDGAGGEAGNADEEDSYGAKAGNEGCGVEPAHQGRNLARDCQPEERREAVWVRKAVVCVF